VKREKTASRSIQAQAAVGPALATVIAFGASSVHARNPTIPLEVILAAVAVVQGGIQALIGYFTRGGRRGEPV